MKSILVSIVAAVLLVGCGEAQPPAKEPSLSIHDAAAVGDIEAVKQNLASGADVNAKIQAEGTLDDGNTPLDWAIRYKRTEAADLLRKHGGKTKKELEAAGN